MNFLEAVRALKEGKCEGIRRISWQDNVGYIYLYGSNKLFTTHGNYFSENVQIASNIIAEDWELVNSVKRYEEVEVVMYMSKKDEAVIVKDVPTYSQNWIKLTGVIKQEIKPKVKHRVVINEHWEGSRLQDGLADDCVLIAEWEE